MQINSVAHDVLYLAGCTVNEEVPEKERIEKMELEKVYSLAMRHMLGAVVASAIEKSGHKDQKTREMIARAQIKNVLFDKEWKTIKEKLENEGIWYLPVKGVIIKNLYPDYGIREFADHDILFDAKKAEKVKEIMESLGYTTKSFAAGNHDVYQKKPCLNFEMHTALFSKAFNETIYEYYEDIEERLQGAGYEKHLTPEDFYIYITAHEYKHFSKGGTGLRSLLDIYLYLKKQKLDMEYVYKELDKLGIKEFEEKNRNLAQHLFGKDELNEEETEMLNYIISSGVYGNLFNFVQNEIKRKKISRLKYALERLSVPVSKKDKRYPVFAGRYPLFYKYKILLPFLPLYRIYISKKSGRFNSELQAIKKAKSAS